MRDVFPGPGERRSAWRWLSVSLASCLAAASVAAATPALAAAPIDPATYGPTVQVQYGTNDHSQLPVGVDLPAPGSGLRVSELRFQWTQLDPTTGSSGTTSLVRTTSDCAADLRCHVDTVLPTGRFTNGTPLVDMTITVTDGTTSWYAGRVARGVQINNPKPTAIFRSPADRSVVWGKVTLTADAAPADQGPALKGVRFYLHEYTSPGTYVLDSTPPYSVDVDALDLTSTLGSERVVAVAEDVAGNLSQFSGTLSSAPMQRWLTVGPPPVLSWWTPAAQDTAAGSVRTRALLGWEATIPDSAPDRPGLNPYLSDVDVFIDGVLWWTASPGSWSMPGQQRSYRFSSFWDANSGAIRATPGQHTATLRATTSYGATATADLRFLVGDGVVFSPLLSNGHPVEDGFEVAAGTTVPLTTTVTSTVRGVPITWVNASDERGRVGDPYDVCQFSEWSSCPDTFTFDTLWRAPSTPGTYTVTFSAQPASEDVSTFTRTLVVTPAPPTPPPTPIPSTTTPRGILTARATSASVRRGQRVTVSATLTRADTARAVPGIPVTLEWRASGAKSWTSLRTLRTSGAGRATVSVKRPRTGTFRWTTTGARGKVGAARSRTVRVTVR